MQDELETHSKPGSFSVYVYYGGSRMKASDIEMLARYDVVLTTYGVLSSAYRPVCMHYVFFLLLLKIFPHFDRL